MKNRKESLAIIYREQVAGLFSYGCKFTGNKELVKDCIHDTFVRLYEKEDISCIRNMKFYLLRSFKNNLLDELSRVSLNYVDEIPFSYVQTTSDEDHLVEADEKQQIKAYIEKVFETLTSRQKEAVYLYYIEDLDYDKIGQLLGLNYQSVRNTIHRGLSRLRERLGDQPPSFLLFYISLAFH